MADGKSRAREAQLTQNPGPQFSAHFCIFCGGRVYITQVAIETDLKTGRRALCHLPQVLSCCPDLCPEFVLAGEGSWGSWAPACPCPPAGSRLAAPGRPARPDRSGFTWSAAGTGIRRPWKGVVRRLVHSPLVPAPEEPSPFLGHACRQPLDKALGTQLPALCWEHP